MKCEICVEEISKYKCPKCRIKYCSVKCYKKHREVPCESKDLINTTPLTGQTTEMIASKGGNPKLMDKYTAYSEDQVSDERLKELGNSEELRDMLANPHLCQMMINLTKSQSPAEEMENAMHEPIFVEFADECLKIVEAENRIKLPEG